MTLRVEELRGLPDPSRLFAGIAGRAGSFFLDSGLEAGGLGRYSFLGCEPFLTITAKANRLTLTDASGERRYEGELAGELRRLLGEYRGVSHPEIPFAGGAVGYLSYELGARWERISRRLDDDAAEPDAEFGFHDGVLAHEHATGRWFALANPVSGRPSDEILARLKRLAAEAVAAPEQAPSGFGAEPRAHETRESFVESVLRIREYIRSGDIYQANLAQRFDAPWPVSAFELYRRLRGKTPAPFASFLSLGSGHVISASPERFLRLRAGNVETRPIKGTRPRGATPDEDARLRQELLASAKERAELLMIVDLERNDLGRVCRPGTIRVEDLYRVEAHPTVFHLVGTVKGELRPECDVVDLLRAAFPGGSITGAPKIRAMQIIDEVEKTRRHGYTGAIGYLGFDGGADLAIAIRTIFLRDGRASYHVGAGIVWDSDPEAEYEETLAKGRALRAALIGG
ncbi:aminodeoxychorismate synthase component I [Opitutaceae bacterium EW11]|nr:aminodeoxychorismate synthase component I [Opitutaceae bacterium EW11]